MSKKMSNKKQRQKKEMDDSNKRIDRAEDKDNESQSGKVIGRGQAKLIVSGAVEKKSDV